MSTKLQKEREKELIKLNSFFLFFLVGVCVSHYIDQHDLITGAASFTQVLTEGMVQN